MSDFSEHADAVLKYWHKRYQVGDKDALLRALTFCLSFRVVTPDWISAHVNSALWRFWLYEAVTMDEAFDVERSKDPRSVATRRGAPKLIGEIWQHIWCQIDEGKSRDEDFFEEVGEKFGIKKTRVKEYWRLGNVAFGTERPKKKSTAKPLKVAGAKRRRQ